MSKNKTVSRPTPSKSAAPKSKNNALNDARETRKFFMILCIGTLLLVFFLYLIFMRTSG